KTYVHLEVLDPADSVAGRVCPRRHAADNACTRRSPPVRSCPPDADWRRQRYRKPRCQVRLSFGQLLPPRQSRDLFELIHWRRESRRRFEEPARPFVDSVILADATDVFLQHRHLLEEIMLLAAHRALEEAR